MFLFTPGRGWIETRNEFCFVLLYHTSMEGIETVETLFLKKLIYSSPLISSELLKLLLTLNFRIPLPYASGLGSNFPGVKLHPSGTLGYMYKLNRAFLSFSISSKFGFWYLFPLGSGLHTRIMVCFYSPLSAEKIALISEMRCESSEP